MSINFSHVPYKIDFLMWVRSTSDYSSPIVNDQRLECEFRIATYAIQCNYITDRAIESFRYIDYIYDYFQDQTARPQPHSPPTADVATGVGADANDAFGTAAIAAGDDLLIVAAVTADADADTENGAVDAAVADAVTGAGADVGAVAAAAGPPQRVVQPDEDEEDEDEEAVRQQMLSDGRFYRRYEEASWQRVRGKKGRKVRNSRGFIGRRRKRRRINSQCTPSTEKSGTTHPTEEEVEKKEIPGDQMHKERKLIALFWEIALRCPPPRIGKGRTAQSRE